MTVDITQLLLAHGAGDAEALDQLVPLVYEDLRRLARIQLRRRGAAESLNTGGLVNEAYLRLVDQTKASWRDRGHFFAVCAIAMHVGRVIGYGAVGLLSVAQLPIIAALLGGLVVGNLLGRHLRGKVSAGVEKRVELFALVVANLAALANVLL